jgi:hypothetical protein
LRGAPLRALVELFGSYGLLPPEQVAAPTRAVPGLRRWDGFQCLTCLAGLTQSLQTIQLHVTKAHRQKSALHRKSPLWRKCKLQTLFAETQHVQYFVIDDDDDDNDNDDTAGWVGARFPGPGPGNRTGSYSNGAITLSPEEEGFFK